MELYDVTICNSSHKTWNKTINIICVGYEIFWCNRIFKI